MHIFDMDGTLIDSNGIWREVDEAFLAKRGFPYTKEYYQGVAAHHFPAGGGVHQALLPSGGVCGGYHGRVDGDGRGCLRHTGTGEARRAGVSGSVPPPGQRMMVLTSSVPAHCRAALGHLGLMPYLRRSCLPTI